MIVNMMMYLYLNVRLFLTPSQSISHQEEGSVSLVVGVHASNSIGHLIHTGKTKRKFWEDFLLL